MAGISEDAAQAIFDCARGSDVAALKALLARHGPAAVAVTDVEGSTPLHVACSGSGSGSVDIVAALVEAGADVDGVDEGAGFTPLVQAVEADYTGLADIIAYLVSTAGAGVNVPDAAGRTPFSHAAGLGQDATVSLLLRRGADAATPDNAGVTPVHHAVLGGQLGVLQHMQELGLPVDITTVDSRGRNALHHALRTKGNATSMLEWLLTLPGVDTALAARTKRGETPYMAAAKAFAKQLHEQAKDAKAAGGGIPLSAQLTIWPDTCGSMLLQAGADHSIPDDKGAQPDALATSALEYARRELADDGASVATMTSAADYEHIMAEMYPQGPNVPPRPAPGTITPGPAYTAEGALAPLPGDGGEASGEAATGAVPSLRQRGAGGATASKSGPASAGAGGSDGGKAATAANPLGLNHLSYALLAILALLGAWMALVQQE